MAKSPSARRTASLAADLLKAEPVSARVKETQRRPPGPSDRRSDIAPHLPTPPQSPRRIVRHKSAVLSAHGRFCSAAHPASDCDLPRSLHVSIAPYLRVYCGDVAPHVAHGLRGVWTGVWRNNVAMSCVFTASSIPHVKRRNLAVIALGMRWRTAAHLPWIASSRRETLAIMLVYLRECDATMAGMNPTTLYITDATVSVPACHSGVTRSHLSNLREVSL